MFTSESPKGSGRPAGRTIGKAELVRQLMDEYKYTRASAKAVVDDLIAVIVDNIENGRPVTINGFGAFQIVEKAPRLCHNVRTLKKQVIPSYYAPRFVPCDKLRVAVKKWGETKKFEDKVKE